MSVHPNTPYHHTPHPPMSPPSSELYLNICHPYQLVYPRLNSYFLTCTQIPHSILTPPSSTHPSHPGFHPPPPPPIHPGLATQLIASLFSQVCDFIQLQRTPNITPDKYTPSSRTLMEASVKTHTTHSHYPCSVTLNKSEL